MADIDPVMQCSVDRGNCKPVTRDPRINVPAILLWRGTQAPAPKEMPNQVVYKRIWSIVGSKDCPAVDQPNTIERLASHFARDIPGGQGVGVGKSTTDALSMSYTATWLRF